MFIFFQTEKFPFFIHKFDLDGKWKPVTFRCHYWERNHLSFVLSSSSTNFTTQWWAC
jgi:hypothetical protein